MKNINILALVILFITPFYACKKEKPDNEIANESIAAEKTNVKTFEIVNLLAHVSLLEKYKATFGADTIELLKTSDSTLTFYVPDVAAGEAILKFELATIKFNVSKTTETNTEELITNITDKFDVQIAKLDPTTPEEVADVNRIVQYKKDVVLLFNTLNAEQKRQAGLFYEANKDVFKSFENTSYARLNASTTLKRAQSDCPTSDYESFYGCTAENIGVAASEFKQSSRRFLKMMGMAGAMALVAGKTSVLGPVAWGITAVGMSLPLGMAGYLLITETGPAGIHFGKSAAAFLKAPWIFRKDLFQATTEVFQSGISTSLNLKAKFRSITTNDQGVNTGSSYFISSMAALEPYWDKLKTIFGNFPGYKNTEKIAELESEEVLISDISNENVEYVENQGQSVKFKTLSGNEEEFSYQIKVSKEGFVEEKTMQGKVVKVVSIKELLFREGWQIVSGTSEFKKGNLREYQDIGPEYYKNFQDCNNVFHPVFSWYNDGSGGFETNYSFGYIKFSWVSTSGTTYSYKTDCSLRSSSQTMGSSGILGTFLEDNFNESTKIAVNGTSSIKVIQMSKTAAVVEITRQPLQGIEDIIEKITLTLVY